MSNNDDFRSLMRRARWDRLFGALVVLVILIVMIASAFKGCSRDEEPEDVNSTISNAIETEPPTDAEPDHSMTVFLSPSTQEDNTYACDETVTEESAMFSLAEKVRALLVEEGITVVMCGEDDNVKKKVATGNDLKCGAYVALHSNAGGDSGTDEGTECYYNSTIPGSQELAENIYNRVAALTPTEDRGLRDETQRDLYEILNNQSPCCLLEVEFHDTVELSQWILDNQNEVAKCIKDGIVAYLNSQSVADLPDDDSDDFSSEEDTE